MPISGKPWFLQNLKSTQRMIKRYLRLNLFRFCSNKNPNNPEQQSQIARRIQSKLNQFNEKSRINSQIIPKSMAKQDQSTSQLRDAILYEDILRNQKRILLYDTNGIQYKQILLYVSAIIGGSILIYFILKKYKQTHLNARVEFDYTSQGLFFQYCLAGASVFLSCLILIKYRRIQKVTVQKVVYDTEKAVFEFSKRNWYGQIYKQIINKDKLMYTQNQKIWNRGANYYDLDTQELFSISLEKGWLRDKQGLFSHLISQRIKLHMKTKQSK